jgi:hypothetical protein
MGDAGMSDSFEALVVTRIGDRDDTDALTVNERWRRWQEKGARHDARVRWNIQLFMAIALTLAAIWGMAALSARSLSGGFMTELFWLAAAASVALTFWLVSPSARAKG